MTELVPGANCAVPAGALEVTLEWRPGPGVPDVDVSGVLLTAAGRVRSDADFVFYNQPEHPSGAVHHEGKRTGLVARDTIRVQLPALETAIDRVMIAASADGGTFGQVPGLRLSVRTATGVPVTTFTMTAASETAMVAGELYRRAGQWKLRAIGQGYDSGLEGLARDFGVSVDEPVSASLATGQPASPRPDPPPVASAPSGAAAVRLSKGEERLPVDMRKRLSLRKQQVAISLTKHGAPDAVARVILVLDASGSMSRLYDKGTVTNVVERMAAVAAQLDDDGQMQAWTFATNCAQLPDLHIGELPEWLELHVRVGAMGFGRKRPAKGLRPGQLDMRQIGIQNEEHKVIAEVRAFVRAHPSAAPTLVLFFSDGGVYRNAAIEAELRAAVDDPVFWQFVGLGRRGKYGVLEALDEMSGRRVDNVGFFAVDDIDDVADSVLYDRLLGEFPSWLRAARAAGVLP
ncbi:stress response protein [Geodermatophilus sabuli]|uniref:Stress response protein n=1 Tax=Geodermatophilus sabuli TaxID=1564158 RepID=A0A7K3W6M9_9ACTN|nr:VWA domain-containing protein [Geodermatophilus sabuli]NEK59487.1 stress response protein [Geodermatophilus sabuli]